MALTKIRGNTQIQDLTVTNTQVAFKDAANPKGILLVKIEDGELLVKSDGSVPFTAPVGGVAPVAGSDLATKDYVDGVATGLDVKASVRVLADSPIALTGLPVVDGVQLVAGDRVLVTGQSDPTQNGVYVAGAGAWVRSADTDNSPAGEVTTGLFTFVEEGAQNAGAGYVLTTPNPITLGTTGLAFSQFSQAGVIAAGAGLTKTGTVIDVVSANAGIKVNADNIELKVSADGTLQVKNDGLALATVTPGQVLVGDNNGVLTPRTLGGDVTIDSNGDVTVTNVNVSAIPAGSLTLDRLASGTAGQLIVAGANGVPTYVTASGDVTVDSTGNVQLVAGSVGITELADNSVTTQKLVDKSVTLAKMAPLADGNIIVGTGTGVQSVSLSGDVTMDDTGVVTINPATVVRVADIIKRETPVGLVDGTNMTFTLANTPKAGTEDVYINGVLQEGGAGNDYTISGNTITMLFAVQPGDKVRVSYFK